MYLVFFKLTQIYFILFIKFDGANFILYTVRVYVDPDQDQIYYGIQLLICVKLLARESSMAAVIQADTSMKRNILL